jgi:predicted ATPase/DNA-binding winged helix-turn-helix (wHTH) protein
MHDSADLRFGRFEIRPKERLLLADGEPLVVGDRAFELLLVLARRPGELVRKNELLEQVWPGRVVEENNLPVQVRALRKLLGDGVISTVPGYGYRFSARLELAQTAGPEAATIATATPNGSAAPAQAAAVLASTDPGAQLFGRDAELALLAQRLQQASCLSLSGPSGVGKTSLARAVMHRATVSGQRIWVDLTTATHDADVFPALCRAAGQQVPDAHGAESAEALLARALPDDSLLVLDNAEHVVAGAADLVAALYAAAPGLRVLVTTQIPLQLEHEQIVPIGPLQVADGVSVEQSLADGAIGLLVSRVRASGSRVPLGEVELPLLRDLCARLDGLPLALEMAAARIPLLGLRGVLNALDQRFALLKHRQHDAPERHRTLQAALDWSHGLLAPAEQRLFRWMGVFAGGCDLDLLVAVAGESTDSSWDVVDRLSVLVEHSLVLVETSDPPRYRLLESMRAYAQAQLATSGEMPEARRRHAQVLSDQLSRYKAAVQQAKTGGRLPLYAPGLALFDNVRESVRWCVKHEPALAVQLAIDMGYFVTYSDLRTQALALMASCEPLVDDAKAEISPGWRARWLSEMARQLLMRQSPDASDYARRACALNRELKDDHGLFNALVALARSFTQATDEVAAVLAELEAVMSGRLEWSDNQRMLAVSTRAVVLHVQQDWDALLVARLEEAAMAHRIGYTAHAEAAESNVVFALNILGRYGEAVARARAALATSAELGTASANQAYLRAGLVEALVASERHEEALREAPAALAMARRYGVFIAPKRLRVWLLQQQRYEDAARWQGYLQRLHAEAGVPLDDDQLEHDLMARILAWDERAVEALGGAIEHAAWVQRGTSLTDAEADALLFARADQAVGASSKP